LFIEYLPLGLDGFERDFIVPFSTTGLYYNSSLFCFISIYDLFPSASPISDKIGSYLLYPSSGTLSLTSSL